MSDTDILSKYSIGRRGERDAEEGAAEVENRRAYSILRGRNAYAAMLDIRLLTGDRIGLAYHSLIAVSFDASGVVRLAFATHAVTVEGRNLAPLYDGLLRHVIRHIECADPRFDDAPEEETFISAIAVQALETL